MSTESLPRSQPARSPDTPSAESPPAPAPPSPAPSSPATGAPPFSSRVARAWRGPATDPRWVRPALIGLLVATGLLYLWGLGASGWANSFYSAAAQAGSESWKAFLFGSSDAANSITVDKPPAALWVMSLSVRVFGLSSWSLLVPQALMGVGTVALLYATVRRSVSSAGAGLLAGAILALTPVAALMFRFNNPDALLTLLLVGAVAAALRAVEATRAERAVGETSNAAVRWLALAGALVGLAFLTKMLQAFLVLPALGVMYLWAADTTLLRRLKHLLVAGCALLVAAGWWIAVVSLWPATTRPYIGGSQDNSILELTLGYNGFGRLTGDETGSVGGQAGWGETGLLRLFDGEIGGQIGWLIPAGLVLGVAAGWQLRRTPRTDLTRAALVGWGLWLVVTALTFSFMAGIFHAYYTVVLAPAVAAVVAIAATVLWRRRDDHLVALSLAAAASVTSVLGFALLDRAGDYLPWLKWLVLVGGLVAALALGAVRFLPQRVAPVVASLALAAALAGPTAYTLSTVSTPHTGSIPTAGPATSNAGPGGMPGGFLGAMPAGGPGGTPGTFTPPGGTASVTPLGGPAAGGQAVGGLLEASTPSASVTALLEADASDFTWVAATIGSNSASGYQLASEEPVMAIGGFNGSDPSPTLAEFQQLVAQGEIHYFLAGSSSPMSTFPMSNSPMGSDSSTSSQISTWVSQHFTAQTLDGLTVYDLSQPVSAGGVGG